MRRATFNPTLLYESESWIDTGNIINNLEVADMRVNRMIAGKSLWNQWQNRISNDSIRNDLGIVSVDEKVRISRLRCLSHVERMDDFRQTVAVGVGRIDDELIYS